MQALSNIVAMEKKELKDEIKRQRKETIHKIVAKALLLPGG